MAKDIVKGIYCITNIVTGEKYIGSSINTYERKRTHFSHLKKKKHYNSHLQKSYNKYGESNLIFSIVFKPHQDISIKELRRIESNLIKSFDSYKNGFNQTDETFYPTPLSREVVQLDKGGSVIKIHKSISDAQRKTGVTNISRACNLSSSVQLAGGYVWHYLDDYEENGFRYTKRISWSKGKKLLNKTGVGHHASKPVLQLDFEGSFIKKYESCSLACNSFGKSVESCVLGRNKSAYGYIWVYEEKYLAGNYSLSHEKSKNTPLVQLSLDGEFISEFKNQKEASLSLKVARANISRAIIYNRTCGGFVWITKEKYILNGFCYKKPKVNNSCLISALDDNRVKVKTFESLKEAGLFCGIKNTKRISKYKDTNTMVYGYYWICLNRNVKSVDAA